MSVDMVLVSWGMYTLPTGAMFDVMAAWPHGFGRDWAKRPEQHVSIYRQEVSKMELRG